MADHTYEADWLRSDEYRNDYYVHIMDEKGRTVCDNLNADPGVISLTPDDHRYFDEEGMTRMRMFAAAPELLDGCKALLGLLQLLSKRSDVPADMLPHLVSGHRIDTALAAIAKATGKPVQTVEQAA